MYDNIIKNWTDNFKKVTINDLENFAEQEKNNHEIICTIFSIFKSSCHSQYYKTGNHDLKCFTLQLMPLLIVTYLENIIDKCPNQFLETLLISLYNLEIVDQSTKQPKIISFRIPSIAQPSIYHEPMNISSAFLTERSLRHWEECNTKLVSWGPKVQIELLNAQNRLNILTSLLFIYNLHLNEFNTILLDKVCKLYSRLITRGFASRSSDETKLRISVCSPFLLEMLQSVYCALNVSVDDERRSNNTPIALQALDDILFRAKYESYHDVILKANAIQNNISTSVESIKNISNISKKSLITNASFRVKKLPDDIPICENDKILDDNLNTITEETDEQPSRISSNANISNTDNKKVIRNGSIKNMNITKKNRKMITSLKNTPILHSSSSSFASSKQQISTSSLELQNNFETSRNSSQTYIASGFESGVNAENESRRDKLNGKLPVIDFNKPSNHNDNNEYDDCSKSDSQITAV